MDDISETPVPWFSSGQGAGLVVAGIDPRAFRLWCEAEDLTCNSEARLEYSQLVAGLARREADSKPSRRNPYP